MMEKFALGIVVGFFLAVAMVSGLFYAYVSPTYSDLKAAQPLVQDIYQLTHSSGYASAESFIGKIRDVASYISAIPVIGSVINTTSVTDYSVLALDIMQNARGSSEAMLNMVKMTIALIEYSMPMFVISLVVVAGGSWFYYDKYGGETDMPKAKKRK